MNEIISALPHVNTKTTQISLQSKVQYYTSTTTDSEIGHSKQKIIKQLLGGGENMEI